MSSDATSLLEADASPVEDAEEAFGGDWSDESDPTAGFSAILAQLAGLREKAAGIKDESARKDFAAEIALSFARQLDAMALEDSGDDANGKGRSHGGTQSSSIAN